MHTTGPTDPYPVPAHTAEQLSGEIRRRLGGADAAAVLALAEAYVRGLDAEELSLRSTGDLAGAVLAHWELGRHRARGQAAVRVVSPDTALDGWSSSHSVVFVVCDDASFLVDSTRMALDRAGASLHVVVHPMLSVVRNSGGEVASIGDPRGAVEAWTMIEIDRLRPDEVAPLEQEIRSAIAEVHLAVGDFEPMRRRLSDVASDLEHLPPEGIDPEEVESVVRLLRWLTRRHFVFLGAATYDRDPDGVLHLLEDSGLGLLRRDHLVDPPSAPGARLLAIARADAASRVHRSARPLCFAIRRFDAAGGVRGEHRFLGLLAASAYRASVLDIPHVGEQAQAVLRGAGFRADSHGDRSLRTILETFPRDDLFEFGAGQLASLVGDILSFADRQVVRVVPLPRAPGTWSTVLVYIPQARFDARLVERVGRAVADQVGAISVETDSFVGTSPLARITVMVRHAGRDVVFDVRALERAVDDLTRPWIDDVRRELTTACGEAIGLDIADRLVPGIPAGYQTATTPAEAVGDLLIADQMGTALLATRIVVGDDPRSWRVKVFRRDVALFLSDLVPVLEHLGMRVRDERAHVLSVPVSDGRAADGGSILGAATRHRIHVHDVGVEIPEIAGAFDEQRRDEIRRTLESVVSGVVESDGFNRLVLLAGLTAAETAVLRACAKYLRQIGFPFSQQYIEDALARHPEIARALVELFAARFDPRIVDRATLEQQRTDWVRRILDAVPSLDDDRIGRTLLQVITATVRTNAFRPGSAALALKFDPSRLPDLPAPRPWAEIWVCSPLVEGVHLRGGPIARGGIRWSDRREDFRTEILGLVKAQMVKNAVIVPVGAKGGFVVKRPTSVDRAPAPGPIPRDEVVARYQDFVSALLDITDDIRDGVVVGPDDVVRHDGDDPYLVVAADKGTATFSDVANGIAESRGFWLGDAFASGGSAGYDHKEMGITARGAWESVRRHARQLGVDADRDPLTVVGIGDMSGDVFGNGLLRSAHIRLVAAFDHRHVFLDPDPDPEISFGERQRLFDLAASSWADYDPSLMSPGGAVVPRTAKQVELSDPIRARLGVSDTVMSPDDLIRAILSAPVDLLWNGGIGTYVKASTESHLDVGDRSNDAVRVDGRDLRCRIVAEGGNLGFTQLGRIEYARTGGLVNTDAIDNSAGVDCSDHEVNIKILLADALVDGRLDRSGRDSLLGSMTDEVADLVLDDNRAQTLALTMARRQSAAMVDVHRRYLDLLEDEGWLERGLEFLPSDRELADRHAAGDGLTVPEFAVLLAYTKNADIAELVQTDVPDDPHLRPELHRYFPLALREQFGDLVDRHRLRREIVATSIVNQMVNTNGITFDHRMTEETGAPTPDVVRAWVAARDIVGAADTWAEVESLEMDLKPDVFIDLLLELRRMVERSTLWLLRHRRPPIDLSDTVGRLVTGVGRVRSALPEVLVGPLAAAAQSLEASRIVSGVPDALATDSSVWPVLHTAFDVVEVGLALDRSEVEVAHTYWQLFDRVGAVWLWDGIGSLPRAGRWATQARSALRDDLMSTLIDLTREVLAGASGVGPDDALERWWALNDRSLTRARRVQEDLARSGTGDLTTLSVSLRQLRNLLATSRSAPV